MLSWKNSFQFLISSSHSLLIYGVPCDYLHTLLFLWVPRVGHWFRLSSFVFFPWLSFPLFCASWKVYFPFDLFPFLVISFRDGVPLLEMTLFLDPFPGGAYLGLVFSEPFGDIPGSTGSHKGGPSHGELWGTAEEGPTPGRG